MDKSQLRRLAMDFADGQLLPHQYRARRRELIDGIADGSIAIEREPATEPPPPLDFSTAVPGRGRGAVSRFPLPLILGIAALVCMVAVAALLLWPGDDDPAPAAVAPKSPSVPELPRARTLIESFVARRDFSPDSAAAFEKQWQALDKAERDEARTALWFGSLTRALRDEMKTQKALAGLAGGDAAMSRALRVAALGEALGIAEQLPDLDESVIARTEAAPPAAGRPASAAAPPVAVPTSPVAPVPAVPAAAPATPPIVTASAPTSPTAAASSEPLSGRQWIDRQRDTGLTLQLFAVNHLDQVEQIVAAHPELPLRILATDGAVPRYRVFHGVYADEAAARRAYEALPGDVTGASGGAIVKSFAAVREDLAGRAASAPSPSPDVAPRDAFTLQLFASASRTNAESLVSAFPGVPLELRELKGDAAPYRVVYGRFATADSAKAAGSKLPAGLLSRIGTPLTKSTADAGTAIPR